MTGKRLLAVLLALLLVCSMAACGTDEAVEDEVMDALGVTDGGDSEPADEPEPADETEPTDEPEPTDETEPTEPPTDTPVETGETAPAEPAAGDSAADGDEIYAEDGLAEGRIGDVMHTVFFDFTVNSAYLSSSYGTYVPAEGNELLVVDVTVQNTFHASIEMYDTDFQAQWIDPDPNAYTYPITTDMDTGEALETVSDAQLPAVYTLAVDESRTGELVFEVPSGYPDFGVGYVELYTDGTETITGDTFLVYFSAQAEAQA